MSCEDVVHRILRGMAHEARRRCVSNERFLGGPNPPFEAQAPVDATPPADRQARANPTEFAERGDAGPNDGTAEPRTRAHESSRLFSRMWSERTLPRETPIATGDATAIRTTAAP